MPEFLGKIVSEADGSAVAKAAKPAPDVKAEAKAEPRERRPGGPTSG
jgi:hypothetical protein